MTNLAHLLTRQWRQRRMRTLLSILSVAIATAVVLGTSLAKTSVRLGNRKLLQAVEERPALEVISVAGGRFAAADVSSLGKIPGISSPMPIVTRGTLIRVHGKRLQTVVVGVAPDQKEVLDELRPVSERYLEQPRDALLSADVAKRFEIHVGDRLTMLTPRGPRTATIVGLVDSTGLGGLAARCRHGDADCDRSRLVWTRRESGSPADSDQPE